jgi:hypothetical protein
MKPIRSILDPSFRYVPSVATSVASTWRRAGWRPMTDEERRARRQPTAELVVDRIGAGKYNPRAGIRKTPEAPLRNVMPSLLRCDERSPTTRLRGVI